VGEACFYHQRDGLAAEPNWLLADADRQVVGVDHELQQARGCAHIDGQYAAKHLDFAAGSSGSARSRSLVQRGGSKQGKHALAAFQQYTDNG
jgi:hypothetical protein